MVARSYLSRRGEPTHKADLLVVDPRMGAAVPGPVLALNEAKQMNEQCNMAYAVHDVLEPPPLYYLPFIYRADRVVGRQAGLIGPVGPRLLASRHFERGTARQGETVRFDAESYLGVVERSVSSLERDGRPASAVTLSRSYPMPVADLWDAATNAERISRWFLPISGDLEQGGSYRLEGNASGVISACEPLSHLALTWEFGEDVSWVEVDLSDEGSSRARATLTHTVNHSEHWETYGPGVVGIGWEMGLLGLDMHLSQPDEPKSDDADFASSPDGRAVYQSQQRGVGASVGGGRNGHCRRTGGGKVNDRVLHR